MDSAGNRSTSVRRHLILCRWLQKYHIPVHSELRLFPWLRLFGKINENIIYHNKEMKE